MELSIILITLLNTLTSSPDLCADVHVDANGTPYTDAAGQTWSRYCEWAGPGSPVLDREVCCTLGRDGAACTLPNRKGRCSTGSKMYCQHGEVTATGSVVCYQAFPSICEFGFCGAISGGGPIEDTLCCWSDGTCTEIETVEHILDCADGGYVGWCIDGALNADGTVDCFDE